ncbi:lipid-transfer protein, partial [Mycobacterium tuberculosis EAS054]
QRRDHPRRQGPGQPSGGLACFGEAIPSPAIAQVCELTWQLRGQATGREIRKKKTKIINKENQA